MHLGKQQKGFSKSPSVSSSENRGDEKDRMVRCKICGFPVDKTKATSLNNGAWAGLAISQGGALTAGSSIGDAKTPAAGSVSGTADTYYDRSVSGGCPCCGTFLFEGT